MPAWQVQILANALPAIEAERTIRQAIAARLATADKSTWRRQMAELSRMAEPAREIVQPTMITDPEDKKRAAAFFRRLGVATTEQ